MSKKKTADSQPQSKNTPPSEESNLENKGTSAPSITPPPPPSSSQTDVPPGVVGDIEQHKAEPTSTASIVDGDKDQFPPRDPLAPNPGSNPPPPGTAPEHPDKPPGYKGTGRPAGSKTRKKGPTPNSGRSFVDAEILDEDDPRGRNGRPVDYQALAGLAVDGVAHIMAALIGPEWNLGSFKVPVSETESKTVEERPMLVGPMAKWMESKELPDLPPGAMVVLAFGLYASRRTRVPNTREKLGGFFKWGKNKLFGFFSRKRKSPVVPSEPKP
jgi:hypothetical protein